MTRSDAQRLRDVLAACLAIESYLARNDAHDDIVFDAVRVRLIEIGEAVKDIDPTVLDGSPSTPWTEIARMRDQLAHRYFDTTHSIVEATARYDIPRLRDATQELIRRYSK